MKIFPRKISDIVIQQKIVHTVQDNGFGNAGDMLLGMNSSAGYKVPRASRQLSPHCDCDVYRLDRFCVPVR